jgi:hypothetical protein
VARRTMAVTVPADIGVPNSSARVRAVRCLDRLSDVDTHHIWNVTHNPGQPK